MDCDICFEQYDTGVHTPKLVPCGHTVCQLCLQRSEKYECPLCRSVFGVHPGHLPTNYTLLRILEERYGDDRIGKRLFPPPPPLAPELQHPPPQLQRPPPVPPAQPPPSAAVATETTSTVIVVGSTRRRESTSDNSKSAKIFVNMFVLFSLVIYLVIRYCR
ncbi:Roquin-2 [Frankliniella fusca]|uniref:Roquin-2 n=1 Tax=Frankliniella fusca TaxID=407009 RepID=A0AAE1HKI6_9NEOP|nr:Roquin-2 [Frankliniella fusca]